MQKEGERREKYGLGESGRKKRGGRKCGLMIISDDMGSWFCGLWISMLIIGRGEGESAGEVSAERKREEGENAG